MLAAYALVAGILFGLFFAFLGIGLNLVFGVLRLVNLSHGDFAVLGGYGAYAAYTVLRISPLIAIPALIIPALLVGIGLYYGAIPRLRRSPEAETASLILFFGISQVIEAVMSATLGNNQVSLPPTLFGAPISIFGLKIPAVWFVSAAISVPALGLLYLYLYRTRLGLITRAVMADEEEARACGVDVSRVCALAFGIGLAFAVTVGCLVVFMLGGISPATGTAVTVTAFAVIVLGAVGNPAGAAVGGLAYGLAAEFTQTYEPSWSDLVPYLLLLAVLLVRPSGLLGRRVRHA
jgi:branched-chain amino acid transport system permease protein